MTLKLSDLGLTADALVTLSPAAFTVIDGDGRFVHVNPIALDLLARPLDRLIGMPYLEVLAPFHRHLVLSGEPQRVCLTIPDRCKRDVLVTMFELVDDFRALIFLDVTESMRAQRNALAQSQISASMTYSGDLRTTLDTIAANVCAASDCLGCSVVLFDDDPLRLQVVGYHNLAAGHNDFFQEAFRRGYPLAATEAFRSGRATVRFDAREVVTSYAREMGAEYLKYVKDLPWDSIVALPMRYNGVPTGALNCFYTGRVELAEEEMRFLQSIADQASAVVENARLFAQAEGKAILEERQRLARELHDSVSQALYGIGLGAQTALERLEPSSAAREPVEYVLSLARSSLAEMRALIFELRPEALETDGLVVTLQQRLNAIAGHHSLNIVSELGVEPALDAAHREALYRVAREALTNSVKHATAKRLSVTLQSANGSAVLTVEDDGAGFDPSQRFPGHLGLTSMRERMQKVGGSLELVSSPGNGTRLRAVVPLQEARR